MKKYAIYVLILANLVPVPGVFYLQWDLFSILFFYWLESAVVGVYNIIKMLMIQPAGMHRTSGIIFFLLHYSAFIAGHGFFIFELFSPAEIKMTAVILGLISLSISHGVSLVTNYIGHKEYQKVNISRQMIEPYKRIAVMHVTIILCAFLINLFGSNNVILILLIVLKIAIDILAHIREHYKFGTYVWSQGSKKTADRA